MRRVFFFSGQIVLAALFALGAACSRRDAAPHPPSRVEPPAVAVAPAPTVPLARDPSLRESAPIAVAKLGARTVAFVADADDRAILAVDATSLEILSRTELDGSPHDVLVDAAGELLVTIPEKNLVVALAAEDEKPTLTERRRRWTSTEPIAMATTPDDALVLVTAGAAHRVDALDGKTLEKRWSRDVAREPRAIIVASDGKRAFVTHASASQSTVVDLTEPKTVDLSLSVPAVIDSSFVEPARFPRHANAFVRTSEGGHERLQLPVIEEAPVDENAVGGYGGGGNGMASKPLPKMRKTSIERGFAMRASSFGRSAFDVQTIDTEKGVRSRPGVFPFYLQDCLLPRGAIGNGKNLVVACYGQSALMEIDLATGWANLVRHYEVPRGPSAIARIAGGNRAIVWSPLARALAAVDVAKDTDAKNPREWRKPLATKDVPRTIPIDDTIAKGRELFHRTGSPQISKDGIACATCHPDGRDDGLVWAGPRGRRRPLTLAGNADRSTPFGWGAEHNTIATHVDETIHRLGGSGLEDDDMKALLAYVRSMKPIPRAVPEPDEDARRGETAFRERGCTSCHDEAAGYSDHLAHDVGAGGATMTPSLVGVGARTALFHDGRFSSVDKLLEKANGMGNVGALDDRDRKAIGAFLRTL